MITLIFLVTVLGLVTPFECPEQVTRFCKCETKHRFTSGRREELRMVDCSSRRLLQPPLMNFQPNTRLYELRLDNNTITSLSTADFSNKVLLKSLDISSNPIGNTLAPGIINEFTVGLERLFAREIRLNLQNQTSLSFLKGLDYIIELDLSRNLVHGVNKLPPVFNVNRLPSLRKLSLSLCRIHKVSVNAFTGVDQITDIDLSRNHLVKVPRALSRLSKLTKLNLRENDITVVYHGDFSELPLIKELDMSKNLLGQRESFRNGALFGVRNSLTHLHLHASQLEHIPTSTLGELKHLEHLDISGNSITVMKNTSFAGRYKLLTLDISGNIWNVHTSMFAGVQNSLLNLRMRNADLSTFPLLALQRLHQLRELDLSFNSILAIESLAGISARRLKLHENRIRYVSPKAFSHYKRPIDLDVSKNILGSLDFILNSDHCTFYKLNITGNGFLCDCQIEELINSGRSKKLSGDCLQKDGNSVSFRNGTMVSELQTNCEKTEFRFCLWWVPKSTASRLGTVNELTFGLLIICLILAAT